MRSTALALILIAAPAALAATPPQARLQKEQGDQLRKGGDAEAAEKAYRAALQLDGGYAEAHQALGELQFAGKQVAKAIESFGYAVEIDPGYALAWYNLAFAARRSGDHRRARTAYEKYLKLRPTDADGHYGLAETRRALGDSDAAITEYQLFIDLAQATPAQAAWIEKARTAIAELKAPARAAPSGGASDLVIPGVAGATAAAIPTPTLPPTLPPTPTPSVALPVAPATPLPAPPSRALIEKLGVGDRAWLSGDFRSALFAYQDAVYLEPTSAVARIRLARAYTSLKHPVEAEAQLRHALELDPGNGEASRLLEELRSPPPAVPSPAAVVSPVAPAAAAASPRLYRLTDDAAPPPAVLAVAPQAGAAGPGGVAAPSAAPGPASSEQASRHYKAALTMIGDRDFKGAVLELDQALLRNPKLGVAHAARGSALFGLGRFQDAANDYQTALAMVPGMATPLYGLAETYRRLDDPRAGEYYVRYAGSDASDVRPELRETARQRASQYGAR